MIRTIFGSEHGCLRFNDEETYNRFKAEERALYKKYHDEEVQKYGIFAGNQNKYVQSVSELNTLDSYPHPLDLL
jgi:hypothetical protein